MEDGSSEYFGLMIDYDWMSYMSFPPGVASRLATLWSPGLLLPLTPCSRAWEPDSVGIVVVGGRLSVTERLLFAGWPTTRREQVGSSGTQLMMAE